MKTDIVYRFDELNVYEGGALTSHRLFSHGDYYDSERIQFGTLRLLNSNYYSGPGRFGQHHHSDLEVVLIPLNGGIEYTDSKANCCIVKKESLITISAGSGINYAINSASPREEVNYLKIWLLPRKRGLTPRHHVHSIDMDMLNNRFHYVVAPDTATIDAASVNQDAWVALSQIDPKTKVTYHKKKIENGLFLRVCFGDIKVRGHHLSEGDCIAFSDKLDLAVEGVTPNRFVLIEVPMNVTLYDSEEPIVIPPKM
ncbi:pirin family protein [Wohlfahrtiimonas larvae]|uniref:Pirin N-terminal domain-containing protein n=1 Tax=Wohlfahrtiimonas larvae TaxID=1157986 RepID=A0ABP9MCY4_9GAMM|nr:pirin family protein [Wohlfahrtiimonas larvae]